MDAHHMCITASEIGEVTFFDVKQGAEVAMVTVGDCIDHMLLAANPSHSTYLLVREGAGKGCGLGCYLSSRNSEVLVTLV